jgi:hypothetical protein
VAQERGLAHVNRVAQNHIAVTRALAAARVTGFTRLFRKLQYIPEIIVEM